MKKLSVLPLALLAACGPYYHGVVMPYESYNEASYTNANKLYAQKWTLEDVQLFCNGGQSLAKGQRDTPYAVISNETIYSGVLDEETDKVVGKATGALGSVLTIAGMIQGGNEGKNLALGGLAAGTAGSAVKGDYTTIIKFRCK